MTNLIEYSVFQGKIEKYDCKCYKLDIYFSKADSRCWTAVVNPNKDNIFVTHHINKNDLGESSFDVISSEKIITDVDPEDIYQTIELILNNKESK